MARVKRTFRYTPGGLAPRARPQLSTASPFSSSVVTYDAPLLVMRIAAVLRAMKTEPAGVEEEVLESGVVSPAVSAIYNEAALADVQAAAGVAQQSEVWEEPEEENTAYVFIPRWADEGTSSAEATV